MQKIDGSTIKLNRGESLNITLSIKQEDGTSYTFLENDKITFGIYNKGKMSEEPVLLKTYNATPGETTIDINLTNEETKIGDLINKPVEYWYEIELNDTYTIIGYDDDGAKILMLYPEGNKD